MPQVTEIRVRYETLASFGQYSNVRPAVELVATVGDGDDLAAVRDELAAQAAETVEHLVDRALVANGEPPRYSTAPRFDVWSLYGIGTPAIVIAPAGELDARADGLDARVNRRGLLYLQALDVVQRARERGRMMYRDEPQLLDCSRGNFDQVDAWLAQDGQPGEPLVDDELDPYDDLDDQEGAIDE